MIEVSGSGEIPVGMESDVPVTFDVKYRYSNEVEMTVKNGPRSYWDPDSCSIRFEGEKGWIRRKTWSAGLEASDPAILRTRYTPETTKHWPLPPNEQRNFLDCVKTRTSTTYPAVDLHCMSTTLHMGVIAIELGRKLNWDTGREEFLKDKDANMKCIRPEYRKWQEA